MGGAARAAGRAQGPGVPDWLSAGNTVDRGYGGGAVVLTWETGPCVAPDLPGFNALARGVEGREEPS